ncbi:MAG: mechanosensitive ion channel family protein [Cyclobacteriaceae bacterium]
MHSTTSPGQPSSTDILTSTANTVQANGDREFSINDSLGLIIEKLENWYKSFIELLPNIVTAILLLILFFLIARLIKKLFMKVISRASTDQSVQYLLSQIVYYVVLAIGFFVVMEVLKLDKAVTSLLAGVGVIGLALGFAFQNIAANFVSGVILTFRKPFRSGDIIEIDDVYGKYVRSNFRITVIETFQGQEVYIPNKDVLQTKITNYSASNERRIDLLMGVSYGDDLDIVERITLEAVQSVEGVKTEKGIIFNFHEFADFSINFYLRYWIDFPGEKSIFQIRNEVIKTIKKAYDQHGITIPFPIRTLDFGMKGGEKLSDLDLSALLNRQST